LSGPWLSAIDSTAVMNADPIEHPMPTGIIAIGISIIRLAGRR
jgi:hypothetical protein